MNEATDTRGAESPQQMGVIGRMVGALVSPGRTFASVNEQVGHKDWLIPMIVMAIVTMVSAYLIMPIVVRSEGMEAAREQIRKNDAISDEQRVEAMKSMEKVGGIAGIVGAGGGVAATILVQSAIFLALANFIFVGSGNFKKTLAVVSYGSLVGIPGAIVTVPLMLAKGSLNVQVGPGLLLPGSMEGTYIFNALTMINLFSIWQYSLIAIGLGIIASIPTKRTACGVFGLWIVYVLIAAAVQGLFGNATGGVG